MNKCKIITVRSASFFRRSILALAALIASGVVASADVAADMVTEIGTAKTAAGTVLTAAVAVVALFLLWKLAKRAIGKA